MRIPKSWLPSFSKTIADSLLSRDLIERTVPREVLFQKTEDILLKDLMVEDLLNEEVRQILKSHEGEIEKDKLDYKSLFDMTKRKLIRERNLIV